VRLALVFVATTAFADVKPAPDRYTEAARAEFDKARAADAKGDLGEAVQLYERANEISPHPATVYNIADVERRRINLDVAIGWYRKYLEMDPKAADRAAVAKLIDELERTPGTLRLDDPGSLFVDGAAVSVGDVKLAAGEHLVEVVTPVTYGANRCSTSRGITSDCRVHPPARADGNVILSHVSRRGWTEGKQHWQTLERLQVPAGHYELTEIAKGCKVAFDVPVAPRLVYVHVEDSCKVTTKLFDYK
jgi:tetratricopeptide (TPR) repeat protein